MIIISDTSPIINLAIIGYLDLLPKLFNEIVIPPAVFREVVIQGQGLAGASDIKNASWVKVLTPKNTSLVFQLRQNLDAGESEAIALALEINADTLLIDERKGRSIAIQYNLDLLGVLGILLKAKEENLILEVKPLMDSLIQNAGFYVKQRLYDLVLLQSGEII
jgi:uncharacterized protein